jgi:choline dehydrogenase-like flavoprotein
MKIRFEECKPGRWDYCIVGSGPAGMTLALELERLGGRNILLVESGGVKITPDHRALSDLAAGDTPHQFPMAEAVNRCLGGTSATWSGRCLPFDPIDFEGRDWVSHSGWPIGPEEVGRYYKAAGAYLKSGASLFTISEAVPGAPAHIVPGFKLGDVSDNELERWSPPLRFGACYGRGLEGARHISVLTAPSSTEL